MITPEEEEEIRIWKEKHPPVPPLNEPKYSENKRTLDDEKTLLELKRLEFEKAKLDSEIAKFNAPSTNLDYYGKMLELQEKSFNKEMEMQKVLFDTRLEIEKLKLGGDSDDYALVLLDMLRPYAGDIMKNITGNSYMVPQNINSSSTKQEQGMAVPVSGAPPINNVDKKINLEEYKEKIRKGELTEEQAFKDFEVELPDYAKLMKGERFHTEFLKIKNGEV